MILKATGLKLSDITDMSEKDANACMQRIDWSAWKESPTQAMIDAGLELKDGISFKIIDDETEAQSLPAGVVPLRITEKDDKLKMDDVAGISGGSQRGITVVDIIKWAGEDTLTHYKTE